MAAGTRLTHFFLVVGDQYCLPGNDYLHSFLAGGLTYELLTATTLIYANRAGITVAAGTRLAHFFLASGN